MLAVARVSLVRLLHKHRELVRLRAAYAAGEPPPDKAFFVSFVAEFPGALRELDRLPAPVLEARLHALEHALSTEPDREEFIDLADEGGPWLVITLAYHATLAAPGTWPAGYAAPLVASGGKQRRVAATIAAIATQHGLTTDDVRALLFPRS